MTYKEIFGTNLTRIMKEKGITQTQLVRELNMPRRTVHNWQTGKCFPRYPDKICQLCEYLGVEFHELVTWLE